MAGIACSNPDGDEDSELTSESHADSEKIDNQGINFFQGSFAEALALASANEKLVFVYASDNSLGPNIVMEETVFASPDVSSYVNEKFVSYKVDLTDESQDGPVLENWSEGRPWSTYLLIDSDGNALSRASRAVRPNQFLSMIDRMLGQSSSTFGNLQSRYDAGERSPEFIQQYLMDAILELAFHHVKDETSALEYIEKGSRYKSVAQEYFASREYSNLINETDAYLIMFYWENHPRGDELVEFVLDHYEEFLAVSSEVAMADFTLRATDSGVMFAAQDGDEVYLRYLNALESYPLKQAVEYEHNRDPDSTYLSESSKHSADARFFFTKRNWAALDDAYEKLFQELGDKTPIGAYSWAATSLGMSDHTEHHAKAVDYAREAYELSGKEHSYTLSYISALLKIGKIDEAEQIADDYRSGLTDSELDRQNLQEFNNSVSTMFRLHDEISASEN